MSCAVTSSKSLPSMSVAALEAVENLGIKDEQREQVEMTTEHLFHAGVYYRTLKIPKGVRLVGVLIKVPTTVVISGDAMVFNGQEIVRLKGHNVLPASANRRQVYVAIQDTTVTMSFRTWAQTVEDAEREFTDEYDRLLSHHNANVVVLTGEPT